MLAQKWSAIKKQMSNLSKAWFSSPLCYRIEVYGSLYSDRWNRFGAMHKVSIQRDAGPVTCLQGTVSDQSELFGILNTLHELHFTLRQVELLGPPESAQSRG
jgi:hypothetical protein